MAWIQFIFTHPQAIQPELEETLFAAGALSITYEDAADQPILEPALYETPLWNNLVTKALFAADSDKDAVLESLNLGLDGAVPEYKVDLVEDKDWVAEWRSQYQPIQMADNLWICPSWHEVPDKNATNILLDPGLAFGTGTHPTTAMCLQQLAKLNVNGKAVMDYGCGSGILAIAALLLGAKSADGVDIDPQAVVASIDNAKRNNVSEQSQFMLTDVAIDKCYDILMANILAGPLVELADTLKAMVKPDTTVVLSGLLVEQQSVLEKAYDFVDFEPAITDGPWLCLRGTVSKAA